MRLLEVTWDIMRSHEATIGSTWCHLRLVSSSKLLLKQPCKNGPPPNNNHLKWVVAKKERKRAEIEMMIIRNTLDRSSGLLCSSFSWCDCSSLMLDASTLIKSFFSLAFLLLCSIITVSTTSTLLTYSTFHSTRTKAQAKQIHI